jgi:hypothetical protein
MGLSASSSATTAAIMPGQHLTGMPSVRSWFQAWYSCVDTRTTAGHSMAQYGMGWCSKPQHSVAEQQ